MNKLTARLETSQIFDLYRHVLAHVEKGQNILIRSDGVYSLMKYEGHSFEVEGHSRHRINRHMSINTGIGDFLCANTKEKRRELNERKRREWKQHKGNIYGACRLDFCFDEDEA